MSRVFTNVIFVAVQMYKILRACLRNQTKPTMLSETIKRKENKNAKQSARNREMLELREE